MSENLSVSSIGATSKDLMLILNLRRRVVILASTPTSLSTLSVALNECIFVIFMFFIL